MKTNQLKGNDSIGFAVTSVKLLVYCFVYRNKFAEGVKAGLLDIASLFDGLS